MALLLPLGVAVVVIALLFAVTPATPVDALRCLRRRRCLLLGRLGARAGTLRRVAAFSLLRGRFAPERNVKRERCSTLALAVAL